MSGQFDPEKLASESKVIMNTRRLTSTVQSYTPSHLECSEIHGNERKKVLEGV